MPINIPMMGGRLGASDAGDAEDRQHATFIPPHLIEQQKVHKLKRPSVKALRTTVS